METFIQRVDLKWCKVFPKSFIAVHIQRHKRENKAAEKRCVVIYRFIFKIWHFYFRFFLFKKAAALYVKKTNVTSI